MFTYSHANTPLGQSEPVYYLSYFIKFGIKGSNFYCYNHGQNSWDIRAITRKNDVFAPSPFPRCNVDVRHSKSFSVDSTLLGGGGKKK